MNLPALTVERWLCTVNVTQEMPVVAVNLSLSPGQTLVKQCFQSTLDAEITVLDIPEHRADLLR